jgi:hypothetical protein
MSSLDAWLKLVSTKTKAIWTALILASLAVQLAVALLEVGHDATPYGTTDAAGRKLGFNDPITFGHLLIMLSNVTFKAFVLAVESYALFGYFLHLGALVLIWNSKLTHGVCQGFFGAQLLLFPMGWNPLAWLMWIAVLPVGPIDGEAIQDGPFNAGFATVSWWAASGIIFFWALLLEDLSQWHPKFKPRVA